MGCREVTLQSVERLEKVLLVANTGWYLHNFRRGLVKSLLDKGLEVAPL
jgi:hypothetical protein